MRPAPRVVAEYGLLIHLSSPLQSPPPSSPARCEPHACRWWPYSGSKEFEANAAMVIIILLSALTCALALNAAIRCFLRSSSSTSDARGSDHHHPIILPQTQQKSNAAVAPPLEGGPTVVYTAGMKTRLAGAEAECAICLSEFVEGEGIRVLPRCKHGFHAHCIQEWLSSHSSCPTCRRTCLPPSPSQSTQQEQPPVLESTGP